jgi:hypothetical protein
VDNDENALVVDSLQIGGSAEEQANSQVSRGFCDLHQCASIDPNNVASQICVGDILVSIDGSNASEMTNSQIVRMARGEAGTHVALGLRRPSAPSGDPGKLYTVHLVRGLGRPVSQRAFGSSEQSSTHGSFSSKTSRGFIVL